MSFTQDEVEQLIQEYSPIIRGIANKIHITIPSKLDHEDLVSCGTIAFLEALTHFKPAQGSLSNFCKQRIKGAMIDHLRTQSWKPRRIDVEHRRIVKARNMFFSRHERLPTDAEIAEVLWMHVEQIKAIKDRAKKYREPISFTELNTPFDDSFGAYTGEASDTDIDRTRMYERLLHALEDLPERYRYVLERRYFDEASLAEIGQELGVTPSRVCHIQRVAIKKLQRTLRVFTRPNGLAITP